MMVSMKKMSKLFIFLILLIFISACGDSGETKLEDHTDIDDTVVFPVVEENPIVTITMEDDQEMVIELYPNIAPNTVANFISLIQSNFYDGLTFHRVIPNYMIQGGDPHANGLGGPGYSIPGEFTNNGFENNITHERGVISMARSSSPNSAGSQFFIMQDSVPGLDGDYAAFGKVIEGMSVVDQIAYLKRDKNDKPLEDYFIKTITVDTKGVEYPDPIKQ